MSATITLAVLLFTTVLNPVQAEQNIDRDWEFVLTKDDRGNSVEETPVRVDLPHDWSIEADFDRNVVAGNDGGYLPVGAGRYSKILRVEPGRLVGRHVDLLLEGAYMNPVVNINGKEVGRHVYGYTTCVFDITPFLSDGDNLIEITVDNSAQKNCRWYSGSGIYRHVKILNSPEVRITPGSVYVTTPRITPTNAVVDIEFEIAGGDALVSAEIEDKDGRRVAFAEKEGVEDVNKLSMTVDNPQLWSPDAPNMYTLVLKAGDHRVEQPFGIRDISFSADKGFMLNGKPLNLSGACVHHDNGVLGARSFDAAEARKVRLLKQAGFNAVRTSHNPPAPAFLDECDRQGLLVIDEIFDGWRDAKTTHDYHEQFDRDWAKDLEAMVRRDRNHPSVIAWSIGNEVIERKKLEVVTTAQRLASLCRQFDPGRPVTSALASWDSDWEIYDPLAAVHDITGYNYMIHKSESDHQRVPSRIMWQTESYPRDAFANWEKVNDNSYITGDFVWTGIDYLGESGIGRHYYEGDSEGEHYHRDQWPWHAAYCGDIDLTGLRKPISHYRELLYNPEYEGVYMAVKEPDGYYGNVKETLWGTWPTYESWTWPGHEGLEIEVEVISRCPKVALYLDDELIGEKPTTRAEEFKAVFPMAYRPGTLKAVGLDEDGQPSGEPFEISTAGKPVGLKIEVDKKSLSAGCQDLAYITVEAVDDHGRTVPTDDSRISFSVEGPGELIATGSADPKDQEGYSRAERRLWRGRAIAVVKAGNRSGTVKVKATSPGLKAASVRLPIK